MTEKGLLLQHAIPCFPDLHSKIKTQKWGWGGGGQNIVILGLEWRKGAMRTSHTFSNRPTSASSPTVFTH